MLTILSYFCNIMNFCLIIHTHKWFYSQSKINTNSSAEHVRSTYILVNKSRAWRETVRTIKNLFWKPWFRGNFDPFVNNANLGAIAQNEQWHLHFHCLPRKLFNAYKRLYGEEINLGKKNTNFSYNRFTPSPRNAIYFHVVTQLYLTKK